MECVITVNTTRPVSHPKERGLFGLQPLFGYVLCQLSDVQWLTFQLVLIYVFLHYPDRAVITVFSIIKLQENTAKM